MRLTVRYARLEDLAAEHDDQMSRGGLLVRGDPPPGIALFQTVEVELAGDFLDAPLVVSGQVVQVIAGVGTAVAFDPAPVAAALAAARSTGETRARAAPRGDTAAKIQAALYGNRDDRMRILRDTNRMLHPYVLKNPGLGVDEVVTMARMTTISPDVLTQIAQRREWAERADVAIALVRNPKTPTPLAIRLLDFVSAMDLRQLAKDTRTRAAVQQVARKKVIGG